MVKADFLIMNGNVFTADPQQPRASVVAIRGNRIAWVGDGAGATAWRGANTQVVDAGGCTVMPGFIDSHFHLLMGSVEAADLQLENVETLDDLAASIRAWASEKPDDPWLVGYQLRYTVIPPDRPLDRHFLDSIVADRPIMIYAYDTHTAWANSAALRAGGLLHGVVTPAGSVIVMAEDGTATGELREPGAYNAIRDQIPKPNLARKRSLLHKGLAQAARYGITSVHNMDGDQEQIELYAALEDVGEMTLRVYVPYSVKPETPLAELQNAVMWRQQFQGSHVRAGAIKLFMDGVLESYTGLMVDEYADKPGDRGAALFSAEHFNRIAVEADRLGLQIFAHCCGDGAVRRALDGYAHAQAVNGRRDSRHRVEHVEAIHPDDVPRFAELGVIGAMQPFHAPLQLDGSDVWPDRVGKDRWPYSFAWQTLREAGMRHAFGSDWPVVSMNPMLGVYAARNRKPWAAGQPVQAQTLHDTLVGYTRDGAYAEFQEQEKGMLRAGMAADLVILDADLFATADEELQRVKPRLTMCDGRVVWRDGV
ncbi:MAG: amidohydrolase [Caldilineaceae bacterium]|nr:amidohydrolase [Caldilineaceae bacterium]